MLLARGGFNFTIYSDVVSNLMNNTIFVRIIESKNQDLSAKKVALAENHIEIIPKVRKEGLPCENIAIIKIIKGFQEFLSSDLTELPPKRPFKHKIKLKGSLPKSRSIYRLAPRKNQALRDYLNEAIGKGRFRLSSAP